MMLLSDRTRTTLADRRGFVMPMVLFALVIMSTMAVAAINVSVNEHRSSRAVRTSLEALLAGVTGLNEIQADWNDTLATLPGQLDTLSSGNTIQIGWTTLASGASYKGEVMRIDNGGQLLFLVTVDGRDGSGVPSERAVTAIFTLGAGELTLGACCDAAAYVNGTTRVDDTEISGTDTNPSTFGQTCGAPGEAKPALISDNSDNVEADDGQYESDGGTVDDNFDDAEPVVVIDAGMSSNDFEDFGSMDWDSVKALSTKILDETSYDGTDKNPVPNGDYNKSNYFGPRVHDIGDPHGHAAGDPLLGTCDTDHPLNFGAPSGPCADFFPIIRVTGDPHMNSNGYIQGIFIMDDNGGLGSELDLQDNTIFNGIILGRGCVEIQDNAVMHGAVFVDGDFFNTDICDADDPLYVKGNATVNYSSCAIQAVLAGTGLGEPGGEGGGGIVQKIGTRWFAELYR